jgi:hypothetical protein
MRIHIKPFFAAVAISASVAAISSSAQALEQCTPSHMLKSALAQEDQKVLILATQGVAFPAPKTLGLIFTADKLGGKGYILEGDMTNGRPERYCIAEQYSDVHLNFSTEIPPAILEGTDPVLANKECDSFVAEKIAGPGTCGPLDEILEAAKKAGERELLWGMSPDGVRIDLIATVGDDGSPAGDISGLGSIDFSTKRGATTIARIIRIKTIITQDFNAMMTSSQ